MSLRMAELLGLSAVTHAQRLAIARHARGRTDGAVEPGRAQAMEEAAIHASAVQQAHGSGVAVGQDRLRSELGGDLRSRVAMVSSASSQEMRSKRPAPFAPSAAADKAGGPESTRAEILRHLAAEKSARDRVCRIAAQLLDPGRPPP